MIASAVPVLKMTIGVEMERLSLTALKKVPVRFACVCKNDSHSASSADVRGVATTGWQLLEGILRHQYQPA